MTSTDPEGRPLTKIPRADVEVAQLRIEGGLHGASIKTEPGLGDLLHGSWKKGPKVAAEDGVVTLTYPRFRLDRRRRNDEITLDPTVPWDISMQGGVERVVADLRGLLLRSLTVKGGASRLWIVLGAPDRDVEINITSGDRVTLRRPADTQVRVRIDKGATEVVVDDQTYGAVAGETVLTTGPVVWNSYHLNLVGARRLRIATL